MGNIINNIYESFRDFIMTNGENPLFWIILFFAGLLIFSLAFNALHKD